jgi:sporulation protein YlmC with PRC-barrel domain
LGTAGDANMLGGTGAGAEAGGQNVSEASLGHGAVVFDRNGDDIGVVDEVIFDQNGGQLRGFVLRVGGALHTLFGGGESAEVSADQVERVDEGVVHLTITKDDLVSAHR